MSIRGIAILTPKASKVAFAFACALIASAGLSTKIALDQLTSIYDKFSDTFKQPPPMSVLVARHRLNSTAVPAARQISSPVPTNSAALRLE